MLNLCCLTFVPSRSAMKCELLPVTSVTSNPPGTPSSPLCAEMYSGGSPCTHVASSGRMPREKELEEFSRPPSHTFWSWNWWQARGVSFQAFTTGTGMGRPGVLSSRQRSPPFTTVSSCRNFSWPSMSVRARAKPTRWGSASTSMRTDTAGSLALPPPVRLPFCPQSGSALSPASSAAAAGSWQAASPAGLRCRTRRRSWRTQSSATATCQPWAETGGTSAPVGALNAQHASERLSLDSRGPKHHVPFPAQ
mmetsp:Transcript_45860/g.132814  ORF Transcript_45860/g.132814 Transcript_45860/m.132814 type:complete len:251 (-) Transcript_45860:435-1187(-)